VSAAGGTAGGVADGVEDGFGGVGIDPFDPGGALGSPSVWSPSVSALLAGWLEQAFARMPAATTTTDRSAQGSVRMLHAAA
jgi:hypothetical protein